MTNDLMKLESLTTEETGEAWRDIGWQLTLTSKIWVTMAWNQMGTIWQRPSSHRGFMPVILEPILSPEQVKLGPNLASSTPGENLASLMSKPLGSLYNAVQNIQRSTQPVEQSLESFAPQFLLTISE